MAATIRKAVSLESRTVSEVKDHSLFITDLNVSGMQVCMVESFTEYALISPFLRQCQQMLVYCIINIPKVADLIP